MRALVIANAAVDETYAVGSMPRVRESLVGELRSLAAFPSAAELAAILGSTPPAPDGRQPSGSA